MASRVTDARKFEVKVKIPNRFLHFQMRAVRYCNDTRHAARCVDAQCHHLSAASVCRVYAASQEQEDGPLKVGIELRVDEASKARFDLPCIVSLERTIWRYGMAPVPVDKVIPRRTPDFIALLVGLLTALLSLRLHAMHYRRLAATLAGVLAAAHVIDVSLAMRIGLARAVHELRRYRRQNSALKRLEDAVTLVVGPEAIDRNNHMNNARYLRVANIARRALLLRTGIADVISEDALIARAEGRAPLNLIIVSQAIRYRREMRLFKRYTIRSTVRWWDEPSRSVYVEHRFVTAPGTPDEFVNAVQLVRYRLLGTGSRAAAGSADACTVSRLFALAARRRAAGCGDDFDALATPELSERPRDVEMLASFDSASSELLRIESGRGGNLS